MPFMPKPSATVDNILATEMIRWDWERTEVTIVDESPCCWMAGDNNAGLYAVGSKV